MMKIVEDFWTIRHFKITYLLVEQGKDVDQPPFC